MNYITGYLIAQLCKNDFSKDKVTGSEILESAIKVIDDARSILGGKVILLDSVYDDEQKVINFYKKYGFKELSDPIESNGLKLQPMVLNLSNLELYSD